MTLITATPRKPGRLEGTERGLDAVVGLVILIAEILIALLVLFALFDFGAACPQNSLCPGGDRPEVGFFIVLIAGGLAVVITTFVYLGRVIAGRRSWGAPFTGLILFSVSAVIGALVMGALG